MSMDAEGLIRAQTELQLLLARSWENLKKAGSAKITVGLLESRLKVVEKNWRRFEVNHETLNTKHWEAIKDTDYIQNKDYGTVEEIFITQRGTITDMIREIKESAAKTATEAAPQSRRTLPRIQLPTFSGKCDEWPAFRDLFQSLVSADPSVTGVERLHYLKTSVKGEAAQLIANLPTIEENFKGAWTILTDHYENKRLLVRSCFASFTAIPKMKSESTDSLTSDLKRLFHGMLSTVGTLESIGRPIANSADLFVHLVTETLDPRSRREWETEVSGTSEPPSYETLKSFVERRVRTLEALQPHKAESTLPASGKSTSATTKSARSHLTQKPTKKGGRCALCEGDHYILFCSEFQKKSAKEKKGIVESKQLCFNCFGKHQVAECQSKKSCAACNARHHSSTHDAYIASSPGNNPTSHHAQRRSMRSTTVLLATARVNVADRHGTKQSARALIDSGSEISLISEALTQRLRLPRSAAPVSIIGVGGRRTATANGKVSVHLSSRTSNFSMPLNTLVLPRISAYSARLSAASHEWAHVQGLSLADPDFGTSDPVDLLLGADVFHLIIQEGLKKGGPQQPIAQQTALGWILSGIVHGTQQQLPALAHQCCVDKHLASLIGLFWEQEESPRTASPLTEDEQRAETLFVQTHSRTENGRYVVRLPVSTTLPDLSHTRRTALCTQLGMERRFLKDAALHERYAEFMEEYEALGHMTPAAPLSDVKACYLPHHGVFKQTDSTKKIRVVFNGSSKLPSGESLNEFLLPGPNLLPALPDVLTRWRRHQFVLVTDIAKMYRQIMSLQEYRLNTVTYGLACAPYLAIRTLQQLAADEEKRYPLGAAVLRSSCYVDDILTGADSIEKTREIQEELIFLCAAGGFPLSKWAANSEALLDGIPTARLFDPLGWLAPVVIKAKILIQQLWLQRLDWDDQLACKDEREWLTFQGELQTLGDIRVPRWLNTSHTGEVELHGFADASERAYAAAVYAVVQPGRAGGGQFLLTARTKVAPISQVSLPRLELCAAALLVKLAAHTHKTAGLAISSTHLWSDSTVALAWIHGHSSKWKTFVANRVATIQRTLPEAIWRHVPSKDNPADCASRGLAPTALLAHTLWWRGPAWLTDRTSWPTRTEFTACEEDLPDRRTLVHLATEEAEDNHIMLQRISSLHRLLRVTAWCRRWLCKIRQTTFVSASGVLTPEELEEARLTWIRATQEAHFKRERKAMEREKPLPRRSPLNKLAPFIDDKGLLRVGGRLKHSLLSPDERHPVILPAAARFTAMLIDACHRETMHGGIQLTLGTIRRRYWIPGGRAAVRRHIHRCVRCVRWRAATPKTLMGDLPGPRVTASRPFTHTGVDYAGPVQLRTSKGRGHRSCKAFLAIFVCFSTKAVHLEVVSDYSADAFLAAFRRFVSRRGLCRAVYSDQGTTFVGADTQLKALFRDAAKGNAYIANTLANHGVQWCFNPPAAPHFGGLWEAAVKSVKHHLRRVIGDSTLTFEEMSTVLAQIEACLNSRPLQALSDDPEDVNALTPGHFLIGAPLNAVPEPSLVEHAPSRLSRWQLLQQMRDHFWHRWSHEYLHTIATRAKWWRTDIAPGIGDLCIIKGENSPPGKWPLARITEVHPGSDGEVRVVTARTTNTSLKRPVTKIVLLPSSVTAQEG
ncbi:PREDICTED: uncharacterized protein LOC105556524 [Vollenhovia emeryi]|uniref:uncharacterized protein LOC105556524 n=1 Tax=Vollenhovia emeryi TaxID=411798 RepID=UPI0005F3BF53|nr:PREDICTED: uncharacterized protein LOC105556524 [Vollenhovia emeryi]